MNAQLNRKKGFTIIEVVLVLAIAGLIFLMVFIALPALQRNQRDTARKNEVGKVASAITSYQSNNRGNMPDNPSTSTAFAKYLDAEVKDNKITMGSGTTVSFSNVTGSDSAGIAISGATTDNIVVMMGRKCHDTDSSRTVAGTSRQAAVAVELENGSAVYCQTN